MDGFESYFIVFHNVKDCYSSEKQLLCEFSSKKEKSFFENSDSDCFVGIFYVGWDNLSCSIARKSFSIVEYVQSHNLYRVEFSSHELPKQNRDEFYQFCFYNLNTGHVYGASCPFQIYEKNETMESFIVCGEIASFTSPPPQSSTSVQTETYMQIADDEDLDSFMVVTKKSGIKEELERKNKENETLLRNYETMENKSERLSSDVNKLNREISAKRNEVDELKLKFTEVSTEKEQLESSRAKVNLENDLIKAELQGANDKTENLTFENTRLRNDIQLLKNALRVAGDEKSALESVNDRLVSNNKAFSEEQGKVEIITKEIENQLNDNIQKLKAEKQKNECLQVELGNTSDAIEVIKRENDEMKTLFLEKEHLFKNQIIDITFANNQLQNQLEDTKAQCDIQDKKNKELEIGIKTISEVATKNEEGHNENGRVLKKLEDTIERQTGEIESRDDQINDLEEALESRITEIQRLNYLIDSQRNENEKTVCELQKTIINLETKIEEKQSCEKETLSRSEIGPLQALQFAYSSQQKQLKQVRLANIKLQQEKELETKVQDADSDPLVQTNEDLKQRLALAQKAFEKKYKEATNLKEKLSVISKDCSNNQEKDQLKELEEVIVLLKAEVKENEEKLRTQKDAEVVLLTRIDEMKGKSKELVQHFEGKIKLLEEEITILKKQLIEATSTGEIAVGSPVPSVKPRTKRVLDPVPTPTQGPTEIPPRVNPFNHVKSSDIAYPPSMNRIDRDQKWSPWLHSVVTDSAGGGAVHRKIPIVPPSGQFIGNREPVSNPPITNPPSTSPIRHQQQHCQQFPTRPTSAAVVPSYTLQGRGRAPSNPMAFMQQPTLRCPVCDFTFPPGFSDIMANAHVNDHFKTLKKNP